MALHSSDSFECQIDRRNTNSLKWDAGKNFLTEEQSAANPLPMWVADMDFKAPAVVREALQEAIAYGVFGYSYRADKKYIAAVTNWQKNRFGWDVESPWVIPVSGVISALKTIIQTFSSPGDSILIQTPVYAHFHNDVLVNGRSLAIAPLSYDGESYHFDAHLFEQAIQDNTKIFILCNPHNPTGNVWSEDELKSMGEICHRKGILIVSDEIHQDFILNPQKKHIPFASLGEKLRNNSITCVSASKTFNLAGLQCANVFIPSKRIRQEFERQIERSQLSRVNTLGMVATEAAYSKGASWVDALRHYINGNQNYFYEEINKLGHLGIRAIHMDSLYLSWIDFRGLQLSPADLENFLLIDAQIWFDKGPKFGIEGHGFMRANLGCPRSTVTEAIFRLNRAIQGRTIHSYTEGVAST